MQKLQVELYVNETSYKADKIRAVFNSQSLHDHFVYVNTAIELIDVVKLKAIVCFCSLSDFVNIYANLWLFIVL